MKFALGSSLIAREEKYLGQEDGRFKHEIQQTAEEMFHLVKLLIVNFPLRNIY